MLEPGSPECEVPKFDVSLPSSASPMTVTAEQQAIPLFAGRKVKRGKKKKEREKSLRLE